MIIGVGIDLVDIERVARLIEDPRFLNKVYSESEQKYIKAQGKGAAQSAAAMFAAKEAFSKALGTGFRGMALSSVTVEHNELGAPYLVLSERAGEAAEKLCAEFFLSLTHTDTAAGAVVVAQKKDR
ncbi:MAG: holo-ACP synthase [Clostridia bacterium]|nr:holo-ACP synthase [Clostridia bacterium]